ncbi:hypothetical protein MTR_2g027490 [Medicago truncatula]|uniref:Uncharacterized protein n=1 Tax=Medicago truncatula TaxID=3880 RepID=G7IQ48_MEDTR|nr:hypothetical protein MTR_2g027490 [Medicago truncatula]
MVKHASSVMRVDCGLIPSDGANFFKRAESQILQGRPSLGASKSRRMLLYHMNFFK